MNPPAHWVHNLDPFAIQFTESFGIRWYGLAYMFGFLIGALLLHLYWRRGLSPLDPDQQSTAIVALVLGVLLGGRIGFYLFYAAPFLLRDPLALLRIWEGGMSSHGGFIGVALAVVWLSRRLGISVRRLGDLLVTLAPPGILLGRLANFINGELWGRVSEVPWAVIFPQSVPPGTPLAMIPPRHPSQLYEAVLEGLIPLVWLQWRLWRTGARHRPGMLTGEFFIIYAIGRIVAEAFREPDAPLILGLTRGMFYSLFVALAGAALIYYARRAPAVEANKKNRR